MLLVTIDKFHFSWLLRNFSNPLAPPLKENINRKTIKNSLNYQGKMIAFKVDRVSKLKGNYFKSESLFYEGISVMDWSSLSTVVRKSECQSCRRIDMYSSNFRKRIFPACRGVLTKSPRGSFFNLLLETQVTAWPTLHHLTVKNETSPTLPFTVLLLKSYLIQTCW